MLEVGGSSRLEARFGEDIRAGCSVYLNRTALANQVLAVGACIVAVVCDRRF